MGRRRIRTAVLIGTAVALLLSSGYLYARYTDSVSVVNHVKTGDIDIGITEWERRDGAEVAYTSPREVFPGDVISKIPRITNYAQTCWVRARVTFSGSEEGMEGLSEKLIGGFGKSWKKAGEYYYCTNPLKKGESVDLFETVTIPSDWAAEHAGRKYSIDIRADAIQAANFKPDFSAMSPWGNQNIELCVHKRDETEEVRVENLKNTVEYSGDAHKLVAAPDDFFSRLGRLMPGDTVSDSVDIKNTTRKKAELFFFAGYEKQSKEQVELLKALEIQIKYNGKEIYKGKLTQDDLNKGISLGKFAPGTGGRMDFFITMPEALGNAYARRNAAVKWVFRVQEDNPEPSAAPSPSPGPSPSAAPSPGPSPSTGPSVTPGLTGSPFVPGNSSRTSAPVYSGNTGGNPSGSSSYSGSTPVRTGDDSPVSALLCVLAGSLALAGLVFALKGRRKNNEG